MEDRLPLRNQEIGARVRKGFGFLCFIEKHKRIVSDQRQQKVSRMGKKKGISNTETMVEV